MTRTTHIADTTKSQGTLHMALELSGRTWKVAFAAGGGRPRIRSIDAGQQTQLLDEVSRAKARLGLPEDAPVVSCYEAGRDGFWVHRMLESHGIENVIVDPASIEVERRKRKRKTDRLDATKLVSRLVRHCGGEAGVWSIIAVPSEAQEDARRLHRERERLKKEKRQHVARIRSLLATQGLVPTKLSAHGGKTWDRKPLPPELAAEIARERARLDLVAEQLREVERLREERVKEQACPQTEQVAQLARLRGIGNTSAWILVMEVFAWRKYQNRRKAGSLIGMTGTPFASGTLDREQGINKAGSRRIRCLMVELAWLWLRYQPHSKLSKWFLERFANARRSKRIGIVAMARRLFIDLWRFSELGVIPDGASFKPISA